MMNNLYEYECTIAIGDRVRMGAFTSFMTGTVVGFYGDETPRKIVEVHVDDYDVRVPYCVGFLKKI